MRDLREERVPQPAMNVMTAKEKRLQIESILENFKLHSRLARKVDQLQYYYSSTDKHLAVRERWFIETIPSLGQDLSWRRDVG